MAQKTSGGGFWPGVVVGVAAGMLLAPQTGAEMRRGVGKRLDTLAAASQPIETVLTEVRLYAQAVRDQVQAAIDEGRQATAERRRTLEQRFGAVQQALTVTSDPKQLP